MIETEGEATSEGVLALGLPRATVAFRSNNREVQAQVCARGAELAVLPCPLDDATAGPWHWTSANAQK